MLRLRPIQARWFETYVPHDQRVRATELLAQTGLVELETDPRLSEPLDTRKLLYFVQRGQQLIASHSDDLPSGQDRPTALVIARLLDRALSDGDAFVECSIATSAGVKVADVAWASMAFLRRHGSANPYPEAPEIVVEVLSDSNTQAEMEEKKALYFAQSARVWPMVLNQEIQVRIGDPFVRE